MSLCACMCGVCRGVCVFICTHVAENTVVVKQMHNDSSQRGMVIWASEPNMSHVSTCAGHSFSHLPFSFCFDLSIRNFASCCDGTTGSLFERSSKIYKSGSSLPKQRITTVIQCLLLPASFWEAFSHSFASKLFFLLPRSHSYEAGDSLSIPTIWFGGALPALVQSWRCQQVCHQQRQYQSRFIIHPYWR